MPWRMGTHAMSDLGEPLRVAPLEPAEEADGLAVGTEVVEEMTAWVRSKLKLPVKRERTSQMSLIFPGDRTGERSGTEIGKKGTYRVAGAAGWLRMGCRRAWRSLVQCRSSMVRMLI